MGGVLDKEALQKLSPPFLRGPPGHREVIDSREQVRDTVIGIKNGFDSVRNILDTASRRF